MHQHREGVHAHVKRDVDGRKMIELLKRDDFSDNVLSFIHRPQHNTNSESIKLNYPAGFAEKDTNDSGVATAVSVVYVTMSPTFSGSVLGYVTASADSSSATDAGVAPAAVTTATSSAQAVVPAAISSTSTLVASPATSSTASHDSSAAAVTFSSSTTAAAATTSSLGSPLAATQSSSGSTATAVSDASTQQGVSVSQQQQSSGMSDGAKAGLAIGIILALALAAGLVFFCWKRAKKDNSHEEFNEKSASNEKRGSFFGAGAAAVKKRESVDSDKSFGTVHNTATAPRLSLRPVTQFLPTFGEKRKSGNLLGAAPEMSEKNSAWERRPQNGENPFSDATARPAEKQANPFDEGDGRSIHSNHSGNSVDGSETAAQKSPSAGTAAAVAVAGKDAAPAQRGPNNVHRVQLDFKPSMDDELELKSGQLVRMLHEYDDGWALCVRMDRSQQGVAPRTCLSKTPVKPRGPPPGGRVSPQSNMRGPPPQQQGARPMTPQQQSPGVARKPVPGQAM